MERRRKSPYKAEVRTQSRPGVGVPLSHGRAPRPGCTRSARLRLPPPEEGKGVVVSVAAHCAARSLRGGRGRGGGRELQLDDLLDAGSALGEVEDVGALGQARAHLVTVRDGG